MNEHDLDHRLRTMLADRAADATVSADAWDRITHDIEHGRPVDVTEHPPVRPSRWRLAAVAASVVAVIAFGIALIDRDEGDAVIDATVADADADAAPGSATDPAPVDPPAGMSEAHAVYPDDGTTHADADDAAAAYLRSRLGEDGPTVVVEPAVADVDSAELATARWRTTEADGRTIAAGTLWLRETAQGWTVQFSTMDDLHVDAVTVTGSVARVAGHSTSDQALAWRVHAASGEPVPSAAGQRRPLDGRFDDAVRIVAPASPVVIRFEHLGGSVLGVAEFPVMPVAPPQLGLPVSEDADEASLAEIAASAVADHIGLGASADPYVEDERVLGAIDGRAPNRVVVVPTEVGDYLVGIERVAGDVVVDGQEPVGAIGVTMIIAAELAPLDLAFVETSRIDGQIAAPDAGILEVGIWSVDDEPLAGASVPADGAGPRTWNLSGEWPLEPLVAQFTFLAEDGRTFQAVAIV